MSQAAKLPEPSMEDILASIRRIIADDEGAPVGAGPPQSVGPAGRPSGSDMSIPAKEPIAMIKPMPESSVAEMNRPPKVADRPASHAEDVLELTAEMETGGAKPKAEFQTIGLQDDVAFADHAGTGHGTEHAPANPSPHPSGHDRHGLLSDQVTTAVSSAFGSLAHTVLLQNARTLDDLVGDMLRPMLKNWLDDNLPTIVERLVRAEIERVSRGRG